MIEALWSNKVWLPDGLEWSDLDGFEAKGNQIAKSKDLYVVPIFALILLVARLIFEETIGNVAAKLFNIRNVKKIQPAKNEVLENQFKISRYPSHDAVKQLSYDLGTNNWSERQIQRWFRNRRNFNKLSQVRKFRETLWRFLFYASIYVYGSVTLFDKSWFWNHIECWTDFPYQVLDNSTKYYYMAEMSFYLSLVFTLLWDNKRKDFIEQIVHHAATLLLLSLSYLCNYVRVGTLVMWCHDISDVFMECAKLCVYAKYNIAKDVLFAIFAMVFFVSRLIYYPFWILNNTWIESMEIYDPFPGYYIMNGLLFTLEILHVLWFGMILKMAYQMFAGTMTSDARSSSEEEEDTETEKTK